jgi:pre-mRNA-splicing factor SYF2/beta-D-xylosidase 4
MADEGRVLFNLGITGGLWFTGPQLNIQRDPRWGRNSNSPSEDPYHTGAYGKAITEGFQGTAAHPSSPMPVDRRFVKVANMMKHWTAYSVENSPGGPGRMGFDGNISLHDLVDTYFPGMRMSAESNISSAMCAYDAINGTPSCINGWMTNSVARETWGWEGVIYTDCGALTNVVRQFKLMDAVHTAAAAIKQGTDAECDSILKKNLRNAVTQGLVAAADLRKTASRIFLLYFKLGMFDSVSDQPMARFNDSSIVAGPLHQRLALDAARESVVLLQNPGNMLPLQLSGSQSIGSVAVVGPGANLTDAFIGEYSPVPCGDSTSACMQTVVGAIESVTMSSNVKLAHAVGCVDDHACTVLNTSAVLEAAEDTQAIVLVIGIKPDEALNGEEKATSGEGIDRLTTGLPGRQRELCEAVIATGKPTVLVVAGGGSISVDFAKNHPRVAVLSIGAGGFAGAQALAEVIFGLTNPSGRLPHTVYRSNWQQITPMRDMSMQAGAGRSYRWLDVVASPPLWSFGDGLSYTHFALQLAEEHRSDSELRYEVRVTNHGALPGANVVLMFSKPEDLGCATPIPKEITPTKSLVEFARTRVLPPGGTEVLRFTVDETQLGLVNEHGATVLCTGGYLLSWHDGNNTVLVTHNVTVPRVVATVPQPPKQM